MKKAISILLVLAMALSLVACGGSSAPAATEAPAEDQPLKMAFFMFENSNTFTTYIRKGLESYGAEKNVVVDSFDGKSDQSTQTDGIQTALAKGGYDIIVVNPVDGGAGATINALAEQYGIPVIYSDRAPDLQGGILDTYEQSYYVGLDWMDPGVILAEMAYEDWNNHRDEMDLNGDGVLQYVLLQGNIAQQNAIFRTKAVNELMDKWNADGTMPNVQLDTQDGNWNSEKGKDVMDTWNVKFGDQIEAVLVENDTMAMGAVESLKTAGRFDGDKVPYVYGLNGIPDIWEMIEDGYVKGDVLTSPYREAKIIIDIALNICAGKDPLEGTSYTWGEFGKDIRVDDVAIRPENIDVAKADYSACS